MNKMNKTDKSASGITAEITDDILKHSNPEFRKVQARFFKEEIPIRGTRSEDVKKITQKHWKNIKNLGKEEIIAICEELYKTGYLEESLAAPGFLSKLQKEYTQKDIRRFEDLIDRYI